VGVGNLGIINKTAPNPGATLFSSTGGVFGGSYNATSNSSGNNSTNNNGVASTTGSGGTSLSALPNSGSLSQFTISFWFNTQASPANAHSGRLLNLGASGTAEILAPNSVSFVQISPLDAAAGSNNTKVAAYFGTTDLTSSLGIGANNTTGEWVFIALSYDGTSGLGNNSGIQQAATGSMINGQFYRGTNTASVVRNDLPIVSNVSNPGSSSLGPLNLGTNASLFLANRLALNRSFDGWMDDVRIYDGVLTAAEVEQVRLQGTLGIVPEPSSWIMIGIGFTTTLGGFYIRRRRGIRTS
jgi:hypothetical protein